MKETVHVEYSTYGCGYLPDLEFKRTGVNGGRRHARAAVRTLYMKYLFPSPVDGKDRGPYPIVLFITGGSWLYPQTAFCVPFLVPLARRGFLVAIADYRGCEETTCDDSVSDVRSAVRYLRTHAGEFNGDPDRIFLMGCSAGAHLSMLAAYGGENFDDPADDLSVSAKVSGVLSLFGPTDCAAAVTMEPLVSWPAERQLAFPYAKMAHCYDVTKLSEMLVPYSPVTYVKEGADLPPTLIAQGEKDPIVPVFHGDCLYQKLTEQKADTEYYVVEEATHGNWRFFEDQMMDRYENFIRKTLTAENQ